MCQKCFDLVCKVYKVHKVYKVRKVVDPAGALLTAAWAADRLCPKDTRDLMDFTDFIDLFLYVS